MRQVSRVFNECHYFRCREKSISNDTKASLMRAAERLFAEKGVAAVSARDIARAAAARNESAVQYHFGSVDSLIRAMLMGRAEQIEATRQATLADLDAAGDGTNLEKLIEAAIGPIIRACEDESGRFFALFLVQLTADPRYNIDELLEDSSPDSVIIVTERIRSLLHHLPAEARQRRMRMVSVFGINLAAEYARSLNKGDATDVEEAIEDAVMSMSGFLRAAPRR